MSEEPQGSLITLVDEEGNEHEFEHLASLEYNDESYVALVPSNTEPEESLEGDGELVILKIVTDEESGEEMLSAIEDDEEFEAVSSRFEEMLEDEYEILDEDEDNE